MTAAELNALRQQHSTVPCQGCTSCCRGDRVVLHPQLDRAEDFAHHLELHNGLWFRVLDRKPDGACAYLTGTGCGIHGRAPEICRRMDCRVLLLSTPPERRAEREAQNPQMRHVYLAGAARLHTLEGTTP
jgi:hypothetical protein